MYIDEEVCVDLFHIYKNLVSENSMVVCSDTSFFPNILYLRFCMINIGIVKKIRRYMCLQPIDKCCFLYMFYGYVIDVAVS